MGGVLYVVATPLGNLDDLSPRARDTLARCALIACEDTRRTATLLARFALEVPMVALHKFSERQRLEAVLAALAEGRDVALVSDGGTPGISDPGALLVAAAHQAGVRVSPIPGPSAVAALVSASGLPADRFVFAGFLPHRGGERRRALRVLASQPLTWVVYETPHRLREALADLDEILGSRTIVFGRELTKIHETLWRGTPAEILARLGEGDVRGEIVIAVAGCDPAEPAAQDSDRLETTWSEALGAAGGDVRTALKACARALELKKPELWRRLVERGLVRD